MVAVTAQCPRRKQCYQYEEQQLCPYIAAESVGSQKANRGTDDRETNDCRARQDPLKTALTKLAASVTPDASEQNSLSKGYFHVPWHNAPPTPPRLIVSSTAASLLKEDIDIETCENGHKPETVVKLVVNAATNTLLNNYCKLKNDAIQCEAQKKDAARKAKTFKKK
ncbi:hypothetical protein HPB48_023313 [Haemaphysalis longicornis]|uniref:Uncharacterized protein n=1 Tax=Haemaphysalis longicornis TaxID=44386 RepID=A0A9J6H6V0_HAELO|nr:hypothetical protein HPB48_023313 [Haemaphysalis longicornis]